MALSCSKKAISIIKQNNVKIRPESHKKVCENKDFCIIIMPSEDIKNITI